ncbi:DUF1343 domain-containing protein [Filobacillus milosensis]|uniref:DUF1343 domain-containing protein n=1 Tax=Filobacillus milosensis TaxID=94137 RepID=A0A4Y8IU95_9BACI|nr:DUF1343 domain-containing protein [Filobacillus milosensis]TFB24410.1 DUF1343 domain-containing protein [Filobacillus milosensis]
MKLGLEVFLEQYLDEYLNKRIGLVTNPTGVNQKLESTIDLFFELLNLKALFSPEHGIRADIKEGEKFEDMVDDVTGLPVFSLYGKTRKPTQEMLENIDVMFFDIQDIGSRYYTFIYTLAYVMQACKEHGKEVVVLDRPNPIGGRKVEGNLVENDFTSFVGLYPIPTRHGMTIGELAKFFNEEHHIHCDLTIIPMEGWARHKYFDELGLSWVPPSPNVTGLYMQLLYPGTCLVEGTNLSEGRGTVRPFEMIGAPFINARSLAEEFNRLGLEGVLARPVTFIPTYQKFKDEKCYGVQLHVIDRDTIQPVEAGIRLLHLIYHLYPNDMTFIENDRLRHCFFDLLAGTDQVRKVITSTNINQYLEKLKRDYERFLPIRKRHLIYE